MAAYVLAALAALFVWWLSTGLVLLLNGLPRRTYRWSTLGASLLAGLALYVIVATGADTTPGAAYAAFLAGVALWGWHELTFLQGILAGPRKIACPENASDRTRFLLAVRTLLYHELAILATLGLLLIVTWDQPNKLGLWTFLVLFGMRLSAKLNVFLGVPNLSEEFLPEHLGFLKSYFGRKPMNGLFPVSITLSTLSMAYVFHLAFAPDAGAFAASGYTLLGALIALGTLEHWLLVLPLPDAALWRWALRRSDDDAVGALYQPGLRPGTQTTSSATLSAVPQEGRLP